MPATHSKKVGTEAGFCTFFGKSLDGLFHLWHIESDVHFSQKQAEMWTCLTREHSLGPSQMNFGPRELAFLRKIYKCLPLCTIQFQVAFLGAADIDFPKYSRAHVAIHHGSMMVSQTIPPEGSMVTCIQQRFPPLGFTHRDFPWLPESFHGIMNCGW